MDEQEELNAPPQGAPLPPLDPRIEARRHSVRSRRRLRLWITLGAVVVLLAIGFGITQSPLLDVDEVEVIGAQRTGTNHVLEAAGVSPGTPLLGLDLSGPRKSIAALPWVDQVRASRSWGGKVTFDITEREAIAQIPVEAQEWALVDINGRVLQISPVSESLPKVLFAPVPEPGDWLIGSALPLLEVSEALIPLYGKGIGAVSWADGQMIVDLPGVGRALWGGRDNPQKKAVALATFLAKVDLRCYDEAKLSDPERPVLTRNDNCP